MQYLVRLGFGERREKAFAWLESHGYKVSACLKEKNIPIYYSCVMIDWGIVFGASVSSLVAYSCKGGHIMEWEEWQGAKKEGKLYC